MNPIELARKVEERYRRYLKTTFYFKDPELRASFEAALASGHLAKGPFLEATPVFKRGLTTRALFNTLHSSQPDEGFLKALHGNRPLYRHQEEAIRKVSQGKNVVVATGTGSGKTEAFLFPILLHLYREFQSGELGPGVRALVLYPMNALANDQRDRLGEICTFLETSASPFRFTFGQYIGETPENEADSLRHAAERKANRLPGELVLRQEMRTTPPHILLTNYSMLEYLLLRPYDSPLFDNGQARWWTFLVLDEAHQYRGSRGIEMAMLLRRLKQRLREGGRAEAFRCVATSATLVGGEKDRAAVARFVSDLFGEDFHEKDMILGETEPIPEPGPRSLSPDQYHSLKVLLGKSTARVMASLAEVADVLNVPQPDNTEEQPKAVGKLLQSDKRAAALRRLVTGRPIEVDKAAEEIFPEIMEKTKRLSALSELVELLLQTKDPASEAPLLSARYHLFLRSLEGAFVAYWPEKQVFLDRKAASEDQTAFEVALCRECGQHYFVGRKDFKGGKLTEAVRDPSDTSFGATFLRPIESGSDTDEDEDDGKTTDREVFHLCVRCGEAQRGSLRCGHDARILVVKEAPPKDEDRADQMAKCGACGYSAAGRDPVREVVHGTDGPHAVIATTLYQALPEKRKKVLAFADGRQEAAFFAWYLEDSYKDILSRNLLLKVVRNLTPHTVEGLSLRELATALRDLFREKTIFPPATGDLEVLREAWRRIYRELLTDEPRISLEGVGLVRWMIKWPPWFGVPGVLKNPPWSLTEQDAESLMLVLLDSLRTDKAVELRVGEGVPLNWGDLGLQASQMRVSPVEKGKLRRGERRWAGREGKRARLLAKLLQRKGSSEQAALDQAVCTLRTIWEALRACDENAPTSQDRLLLSVDDARRLNPDWWRARLIDTQSGVFQCSICARLQMVSVQELCVRHGCNGTLKAGPQSLDINHYRLLYQEVLPGSLRVEEHTAQLDHDKAREFQREFKNGLIHVLSCSTTFELGVDLGDLDTIFLRNVPPEAFNYAQRVGRAGRRSGYPGFAITYCRRGPHDLYHFGDPEHMLIGQARPPALSLRNEKIVTRHITAAALSAFLRAFPERFKSVETFLNDFANPTCVTDLRAYLRDSQATLEASLRPIIPPTLLPQTGLDDGSWIHRIAGEESRLSLAEAAVASDYQTVKALEAEAARIPDYDRARWAQHRARTIAQEEVLSFLSRKAVIPKYGFPVDVVELDTHKVQWSQEAAEVSLQRDLTIALSEFAPTSKLVANKKLWTSYGLKRVAEKEWPRKSYKRCVQHNVFLHWGEGEPEPSCQCDDHKMIKGKYVVPLFGFVTDREKPKPPTSRTNRVFTTRPYFAGSRGPKPGTIKVPVKSALITVTKASPGFMVVLCEGRRSGGFYICGTCGAGFRTREISHKTPLGQDCHGTLGCVSLGHEFVTDVLQLQCHVPAGQSDPVLFAYSLAYALVEGAAEYLEVPSTDLSATVGHAGPHPLPRSYSTTMCLEELAWLPALRHKTSLSPACKRHANEPVAIVGAPRTRVAMDVLGATEINLPISISSGDR